MSLFKAVAVPLACLVWPLAYGQWDLHFDGTIPVTRQGAVLDLAWAGGINFVHVSDVDLNGDGLKDLFLFDRGFQSDKGIILQRNTEPGVMGYTVTRAHDHISPLDTLHDWALLRDYNCDGKEDIFSHTQAGFGVWKNTSSGATPSFELVTPRVNSNYISPSGAGTIANLFVSEVDIPGIEDVDGDGDLDILTFSLLGSYIEYHKNLSMELYGTCDSLAFEVRNKCWGYFAENFSTNSVTLNAPCPFNVPAPEMDGDDTGTSGGTDPDPRAAHAGSSVLPIDLNGDGVKDLLLGDISFDNLVGLYNGGSVVDALMTSKDTLFPTDDESVDLTVYPCASYEDVDGDGKRDLLVGSAATSLANNFEGLWYYRNNGSDAGPVLDLQQRNLFQDRMIEVGEGAYPVPFDHDSDGLMDLIVANNGYFNNGLAYLGKLALFRNTGTVTAPAFELITDDYMSLSTSGIGIGMYPAFGDLDGDGDKDMYMGDYQGRLHFYRNTGGSVASFQLEQPNIIDGSGTIIDVGQLATPIFCDLDADGLLDMVIGERNGNLNYYRNVGSASVPSWNLVSEALGGVSTVAPGNVSGFSVPFIFISPDGDREMLLGSETGGLYHYAGIEGNIGGAWSLQSTTFMDIHDGERTGLCLHDFTGDNLLDLVVGNYRGGLSFWRSDLQSSSDPPIPNDIGLRAIPNPASDVVMLEIPEHLANATWQLHNGIGQRVLQGPIAGRRTAIDVSGLSEGMYIMRLVSEYGVVAHPIVIAH